MNRQQEKNHQAAETTMIAGRRQNIRRMKEAFRKHGRKQRRLHSDNLPVSAALGFGLNDGNKNIESVR